MNVFVLSFHTYDFVEHGIVAVFATQAEADDAKRAYIAECQSRGELVQDLDAPATDAPDDDGPDVKVMITEKTIGQFNPKEY